MVYSVIVMIKYLLFLRPIVMLLTFIISSITTTSYSQSIGRNYILARTFTDFEGTASLDSVYYYDGLGRLEQTILRNASLQGEDIVTLSCHKEYDSSQLSVVRREDEDGNTTFEFTDKSEQLLLIRQILQASSGRQQMEGQKIIDLHSHPNNGQASNNDMNLLKVETGAIYFTKNKELLFYNNSNARINNESYKINTSRELLNKLNEKFMKQ